MGTFTNVLDMVGVLGKAAKLKPKPRDTKNSLGLMIQERAETSGPNLMCIFEGTRITWDEFNQLANRIAHKLKSQGRSHVRGQTPLLSQWQVSQQIVSR